MCVATQVFAFLYRSRLPNHDGHTTSEAVVKNTSAVYDVASGLNRPSKCNAIDEKRPLVEAYAAQQSRQLEQRWRCRRARVRHLWSSFTGVEIDRRDCSCFTTTAASNVATPSEALLDTDDISKPT